MTIAVIVIVVLAGLIGIAKVARWEVYRGPALAVRNVMPHVSTYTRTIFVTLTGQTTLPRLHVAEVSLDKDNAIFGGTTTFYVHVKVVITRGLFGLNVSVV